MISTSYESTAYSNVGGFFMSVKNHFLITKFLKFGFSEELWVDDSADDNQVFLFKNADE